MAKEKLFQNQTDSPKSSKLSSISTDQLEYTAERLFTYGTITVGIIAFYVAIIYMGVQQLKK